VIKHEVKKGMKDKSKKGTKIIFLDCDQCNLKFLDDNSLNNHKKEHKKGLLKVKEEKLDEDEISETKTKKVSRETPRVHTTGRKPKFTFLDCDHCKLKFMDERALKMHVMQSHKKAKKLEGKQDENSSDDRNEYHEDGTTEDIESEYTPENLLDSNDDEVESKNTLVESEIHGMDKPKANPKVSNHGNIKSTHKIVFIDCNQCNKKFLDEKGLASHRITTHREKV